MVLLQLSDMMAIPTLPMKIPKQLIRDDADPVFSRCCSNIKFAPGVLMPLVRIVAGNSSRAKIQE